MPIWWLNGDRVADNYEDFYDGSWDNKNGKGKNEFGNSFSDSSFIFTGSRNNGTAVWQARFNGSVKPVTPHGQAPGRAAKR